MPAALLTIAPENHVRVFAVVAALVSFVAMGVPPIAGAMSDAFRRRGVPRRAFIFLGAAIDVVALLGLAEARSLGLFAALLLVATFGANISLAAYQALLPDVVPRSSWGAVSGVRSVAMVIGTVVGIGVAAGTYPQSTFIGIAVAVALGAFTLFGVSERITPSEREGRAKIGDWHDFIVVFTARLFLAFGLSLLMTFVLYFFRDVLRVSNPSAGTGFVAFASLAGAIASGIYLGWLSDRFPRKYLVALCGIPMTLAAAGFAFLPEQHWMYAFAVLFGIGFGGVLSTGWALAIDSVPKLRDVARDLGIWGIAQNFPAVIAPLFGGWLLSRYGATMEGYRLLFLAAAASFAVGSLSVLSVGRPPLIPWWMVPLRFASGLFVWIHTHVAYRVRMFGQLPRDLHNALVISNHQNEIDLMAFTALGFLRSKRMRPFTAATAKLLFEPGFLAIRLPRMWRLLRKLNMDWFFMGIGMFPIENELQSRAIARWAVAAERLHGPMRLEEVFKPAVVERHGLAGLTTRDLFDTRYFAMGRDTYVRITELQPAIGKEQIEAMRRGVAEDLHRFEDVVKRGAVLYVTPEGDYSRDGAMLPFRSIWERLEPAAEQIYIAAISYDPFVGKKLSQLYHVVAMRNRSNARRELCVARSVTTSALLAKWMLEHNAPFSTEDASTAIISSLAALPAGVFVDPELERSPGRQTAGAIKGLRELGILQSASGRHVLTEERRHPAFPNVQDIVAFQARVIDETLAAARGGQPSLEVAGMGTRSMSVTSNEVSRQG